ncbi:MAG: hypothetical protein V4574_02290 [Pseudomonadota bacterium]
MTRRYLFLLLAAALLVVLALSWRQILFGYAMLAAERRPALIADAARERPESAVAFGRRFARGVAEAELLGWLRENGFSIYPRQHRAERLVLSLPCNENIVVTWSSDAAGRLERAAATVREAGCL